MSITDDVRAALRADSRAKKEIARLVGIDPISLSLFQNGHRGVSLAVLDKLCDVLGITVSAAKGKGKKRGAK